MTANNPMPYKPVEQLSEKNRDFKREFRHLNFKIILLLTVMLGSILIQAWLVIKPKQNPVIASINVSESNKTDSAVINVPRQKTGK